MHGVCRHVPERPGKWYGATITGQSTDKSSHICAGVATSDMDRQSLMTQGLVLAGRYRLLSKLGEGGMGAVWRAEHLTLGTHVAIKLIDPSIARSEEALARFRREAQAAAELRSVHVVHILDYGVEEGTPYIAMELLDGESLSSRLERVRRLPPREVAELFTQIGRALARAHQQSIVHRDLKPDNIYLVRDGDDEIAKVLDFGIAKKVGLKATSSGVKTQTGAMLGTPYYMSPEQARARSSVDHRTDIWSLGIIAYECLTGVRPFDGETLASLLVSICTDALPTPSTVADVPPGFDAWFARAACRDLDARFQSVGEAVTQLREVCGVGQVRRTLESTAGAQLGVKTQPNPVPLDKTVDPSARTLQELAQKKSNRRVFIGLGLAILLAGLAIVSARVLSAPAPATSNASISPQPVQGTTALAPTHVEVLPSAAPASVPSSVTSQSASPVASPEAPRPSSQTAGSASPNNGLPTAPARARIASNPRNSNSTVSAKAATPGVKRDYDKSVGF